MTAEMDGVASHATRSLMIKRATFLSSLSDRRIKIIDRCAIHSMEGPRFSAISAMLLRMRQINVPTVEPVFYGERREGDKPQAVLATVLLEGYTGLNSLLQDSSVAAPVRLAILHRLSDVVQLIHRHRLQHNSLGGNHVLVKLEEDNAFDLRIMGLDKMRHGFRLIDAAVRDLEKFIRRTPRLTKGERDEFLLHYAQNFSYALRRKLIEKINQRSLFKRSRKGMVVPICGTLVLLPATDLKYTLVSINRLGRIRDQFRNLNMKYVE